MLQVDRLYLLMVSKDSGVGVVWRQLDCEALFEPGNIFLEEPVGFVLVRGVALIVFESDDAAGITAGRVGHLELHILIEVAASLHTNLDDLAVFYDIFMAIGTDAPDMHRENLAVFIKSNMDNALISSTGPKDPGHVAMVLNGFAVRSYSHRGLIEQDHSVGGRRVLRGSLSRGSTDPVRNGVLRAPCDGRLG